MTLLCREFINSQCPLSEFSFKTVETFALKNKKIPHQSSVSEVSQSCANIPDYNTTDVIASIDRVRGHSLQADHSINGRKFMQSDHNFVKETSCCKEGAAMETKSGEIEILQHLSRCL